MPTIHDDTPDDAEDIGEDRLRGVRPIARFLKETERHTSYLIAKGIIPTGREGSSVIASKRRLRQWHRDQTGGELG